METRTVEPDPGYEPIPLDVLLDSEPDEEDAEPLDDEAWEVVDVSEANVIEPPPQPKHSVRAEHPGGRGCWARAKHGESCGAAAIRGTDYCSAHTGLGVSANPAQYAPLGQEAAREARAVRARMRLQLGMTRKGGPRSVLKARAFAEAERLAASAINGAMKDPRLALAVIKEADPAPQAEISVSTDLSVEDVQGMSYSQLLAVAEKLGIDPSPPDPQPAPLEVTPESGSTAPDS